MKAELIKKLKKASASKKVRQMVWDDDDDAENERTDIAEEFSDFEYGKNAIVLQVKEALLAFHYGDDEEQAVFDVNAVDEMYVVDSDGQELVVHDKEGEEIHRCRNMRGCVMDIIHAILENE